MKVWPLALLLLSVAACNDAPPTGQVVARVNGMDITRRDLLIEMDASGIAADADLRRIQPGLLDTLVERTVLKQEAIRQQIDRSPEFLGAYRRNRDMLLVEQLRRRISDDVAPPTPASIAAFITRNRQRFADHRLLLIERLSTAGTADKAPPDGADAEAWLRERHIPYTRSILTMDSLTIPEAHQEALAAAGGWVALKDGHPLFLDRLLTSSPAPLTPEAERQVASDHLHAIAVAKVVENLVKDLRRSAKVDLPQPSSE